MKTKTKTLLVLFALCGIANAAEIQHTFNSPAFSGVGYSSHVLTIQQLETQQKDKNKAAEDALKAKAEQDALNTPQAKFTANLESRVYAQLAKQLTDSLFGAGGAPTCTAATAGAVCGSIPDLAGNSVTWKLGVGSDTGMIIITITNLTNPTQTTTMKVPSGSFAF
jgi:hypothetical protein